MLEPIKTEKLYNIIVRKISGLIKEQKLESGDRLPSERELAAALSVSRASVRQAIAALSAKGILVMRQGDGTYVSDPKGTRHTLELFGKFLAGFQIDPDEILEIRIIVECEAARFCAVRADARQIKKLQGILEKKKKTDKKKESKYFPFNHDLHFAIVEGAHNKALYRIMEVIWDIMGSNMWPLLKKESNNRKKQIELHLDQHEQIVYAICARDGKKAYQEMYNHLVTIEKDIDSIVNRPSRRKSQTPPVAASQ
jgi:GntR family transcriptional repressor for pyruvate dehydrogenase complex